MKKIAVIFNGGTISMKIDEKLNAAVPYLSSDEIISMTNDIDKFANLEIHTFSSLPGPHITPDIMLKLSNFIKTFLNRDDIDGVVITHGTDTLEETAFFLDLTIKSYKPVIITGAMRSSSELGYDGPSNLTSSICTAISEDAKNRGVLACLNGEINCASEVTKESTMSLNTFKSPNFGPLGIVDNNKAIFYRKNLNKISFNIAMVKSKVDIIKCFSGADSSYINFCIENNTKGIVIEALGRGNVPKEMVPAIKTAINNGIPIVLVSRCFKGRVNDSYGYDGGGKNLHNLGVIFGDTLPSQKARIKLIIALSANLNIEEIRSFFEKNLF